MFNPVKQGIEMTPIIQVGRAMEKSKIKRLNRAIPYNETVGLGTVLALYNIIRKSKICNYKDFQFQRFNKSKQKTKILYYKDILGYYYKNILVRGG